MQDEERGKIFCSTFTFQFVREMINYKNVYWRNICLKEIGTRMINIYTYLVIPESIRKYFIGRKENSISQFSFPLNTTFHTVSRIFLTPPGFQCTLGYSFCLIFQGNK